MLNSNYQFRQAKRDDLYAIVSMMADDKLGATRETVSDPLVQPYVDAFEAIDSDPNHLLVVLDVDGTVSGVMQLIFTPHITHHGSWRCTVEGVRISSNLRGQGFGEKMMTFAIEQAQARGCRMIQLTSNKKRTEAFRFYERIGFVASHAGFKLEFD